MFFRMNGIYLQVPKLHFLITAYIAAAHGERQDLSLGKIVWKKLFLCQHFIVYWTFLPCVPTMKEQKSCM